MEKGRLLAGCSVFFHEMAVLPIDGMKKSGKITCNVLEYILFRYTQIYVFGGIPVPSNERGKEIKRRRHRKIKVAQYAARVEKGTLTKEAAADKLRKLTIGSEQHIENLGL